MIHPLTPQERSDLNAWIAEHVYEWTNVRFGTMVNLAMLGSTERWYGTPPNSIEQPIPDYCTWGAAGPLFDRYPEWRLYHFLDTEGDKVYTIYTYDEYRETDNDIAEGTTGPEAIAKAVKQYEEQRHER